MIEKEADFLEDLRTIEREQKKALESTQYIIQCYEKGFFKNDKQKGWKAPPNIQRANFDYQVEVLSKCGAITLPLDEKTKNFLGAIASRIPEKIIMFALGMMQDKRLQNKDLDKEYTKNLFAYYITVLKDKCNKLNFFPNIDW